MSWQMKFLSLKDNQMQCPWCRGAVFSEMMLDMDDIIKEFLKDKEESERSILYPR